MSLKNAIIRAIIQRVKIPYVTSVAARNEYKHRYHGNNGGKYSKIGIGVGLLSAAVIVSNITDKTTGKIKGAPSEKAVPVPVNIEHVMPAGQKKPGLPTYSAEEVSKHDTLSSFWVIYKHGVYDVTKFVSSHPGGEQIQNAAGLSVEPFWNVYGMHKTNEVYQLLESYRIGNLRDEDVADYTDDEMWAREPARDKRLIVKAKRPFNAEIPAKYQVEHFDTPNELFYVRHHMAVPEVDRVTHKIQVEVVGARARVTELSMSQLTEFRPGSVRAALMCAGNRRSEMAKHVPEKQVRGISWDKGAVSNAVWSGVYLRDVLLHCGVDVNDVQGKHVILRGADMDAMGNKFSTSIPLHMAVRGHVVLATHMNGEPLPREHGGPLRVIVPGAPAVRSVKWLECITVSEEESSGHWHTKDYRSFNASETWESADFSRAPPIYLLPVTSAICVPADGDEVPVHRGHIEVQGYAYSGGGAKVLRVDISPDRGYTWIQCDIHREDDAPPQEYYSWSLWKVHVPVQEGQEQMELWVKATDSNFNTQPETFQHIWNIRGILSNAYHRIDITLTY